MFTLSTVKLPPEPGVALPLAVCEMPVMLARWFARIVLKDRKATSVGPPPPPPPPPQAASRTRKEAGRAYRCGLRCTCDLLESPSSITTDSSRKRSSGERRDAAVQRVAPNIPVVGC